MVPAGYTAVVYGTPECEVSRHLAGTLGEVVRCSRHGVLVSAAGRAAPHVVVQPCDAERKPVACALQIGPLRDTADVEVVGEWLRTGDLNPAVLPDRLFGSARRAATAGLN